MDPGQLIININTNINTRLKFIINTNINAQAQYSRIPGPIHRFILFCTKVIGHTKTKRSQITKVIEQKQTFLLSQSNTTQADPQMKSTNWDVPKNTFFYSIFHVSTTSNVLKFRCPRCSQAVFAQERAFVGQVAFLSLSLLLDIAHFVFTFCCLAPLHFSFFFASAV